MNASSPLIRRFVTSGLAALLAAASFIAHGQPAGVTRVTEVEGITEYRLANGLQVLLAPDASKPTTTVNMTFRVGSRHENYGETGMAHLLEHLIFKGTPKTANAWAEFSRRGLRANGTTWVDRTNYFASFAASDDNLNWYLSWQADAMVNSFIAKADLDTEMTVVRNEMEMGENNPGRVLFEKGLSVMYDWHNYGKSTIGARADVENVDIARLQVFYKRYYQPDNATLVVAGKFDVEQVLRTITQQFGVIAKPDRALPVLYTLDPVQDGEREVTVRRVGGVPLLYAMYHGMPGPHSDFAALQLMLQIMGDTPSGRLHKALVEKGLAAATFAFGPGVADPGFMAFGAQLGKDQDIDKARITLLQVLEEGAKTPFTTEELERARTAWLKGWELSFTNPETVGVALTEAVAQGEWRLFFLQRDRVKAVKLADLQRVANERLLPANRTLARYIPTEKPQRAPAPERVDVAAQLKDFKGQAAQAVAESFEATPANIEARTQRSSLPSGMKVALLPKSTRGQAVQATLRLHFGDESSLRGHSTAAAVASQLLSAGTATLSRQQVRDRFDQLKASVRMGGAAEGLQVSVTTTRDNLPAVIELAGQLLRAPTLPADMLEEVRRQAIAGIEAARQEPDALVGQALSRHGNPYAKGDVRYAANFDEQLAELRALTREQLQAFHARFYGAANAEFAAVGDMDVAALQAALTRAFGDWKGGAAYTRVPRPRVEVAPTRMVLLTPDKQSATLMAKASLAIKELDPDHAALMLANHILGGGTDSRLWKRIREKDGLSYDVRSGIGFSNFEANSTWQMSAIFAPQNRAKVEAALKEEIERARKDGFTAGELDAARNGILNGRKLSRAQDAGVASALAGNLFLGRDFLVSQRVDDALSKATLDEVNAALRKYLDPARLVMGVGGDFKD